MLFAPEEMLLIAGSPSLRRAVIDQLADLGLAGLRRRVRDLRPDAPAAEQPAPGDPRGGRRPRRAPVLGHRVPRLRRRHRRRAAAPARDAGRAAGRRPCRDRPRRGGRRPADPALRDERPATPRRVAAGRPRPAPGRDGRQGGLERLHARRAASRRPGVRAGGPGPGHVRLARPAADGDPGPQAGRARRGHRPGRPAAAPAPRRRLLRARPGAPVAPGPPHRGPAPGLRDDDDARRPRPGAARDRDGLGGARRSRRRRARGADPADAADAVSRP